MTNFTNFGENKILDKFRGEDPPYASSWFFAFGSAADDGTFTELTGTALPRVALIRSTDNWAGTQAPGSTGASSGTSHTTSTNVDVDFSTASSSFATPATHIGLFDQSSGGNCWIWAPLAAPVTVNAGDSPTIAAGSVVFSLGLVGGCSDYLANKMIDEIFRGTAYAYPATTYVCMFSTAPTNAGGGTELSGGGYARVALPSTMDDLCGSQGAGTTDPSSGTAGRISNNFSLLFPDPTAGATVRAAGLKDAASGGNLLFWQDFAAKSISAGGAPATLSPDALGITVD
jgi:hypothetical protein